MSDDGQGFITFKEAAALVGVHPNTVHFWSWSGRLTATTLYGRKLTTAAEVTRVAEEVAQSGHGRRGPRIKPGEEEVTL